MKLDRIKQGLLMVSGALLLGTSQAAEQPNVVIIYGDDVGYGDVGAYGSRLIPTPNIDRLAAEGLRFTDGHSSAATCSPSRYSMLTGVHAFRDGVSILGPTAGLSVSTLDLTLPKLFRQAGYRTGIVGKWHLGLGENEGSLDWNGAVKPGPLEVGFDSSFLLPITNDRVPCVYVKNHYVVNLNPNDPLVVSRSLKEIRKVKGSTQYPDGRSNPEAMNVLKTEFRHNDTVIHGIGRNGYMAGGKSALWDDETMGDVLVEKAQAFLWEKSDKPFFLFFSTHDIHTPRMPAKRFCGTTTLSARGDAMVQFDWATGQIMKTLADMGVADDTIVIFSSDNGPVYQDAYVDGSKHRDEIGEVDRGHDASGIWRNGKYSIYEGGTRVPLIIRWPGRIQPGVSDALVNQIDFIASFASLLKIDLAEGVARDSRNTLDAFLGKSEQGLPFMIEEAMRDGRALRIGDWKFIAAKQTKAGAFIPAELYDLNCDPGELNNLMDEYPEKAAAMAKRLKELMEGKGVRYAE
ncbi:sulfatase-like hydrolase/transferase [Pontiella agarivorans]|uniref:Sulfatase-like hydrolase/transferase n=1 Tax=Pontiella agarivorans TaxID=3038953 RepID=A0ABU5N1M1_9BACT|nr:sulfatase-like hydrolase/transferase [Pontiella agarivorans]MDZ8120256.1 sulfatase-like hydrolase/transferase [Pontiella agarivorans]